MMLEVVGIIGFMILCLASSSCFNKRRNKNLSKFERMTTYDCENPPAAPDIIDLESLERKKPHSD
ncbi:hypothetical protein TetV_232 [Tetraselmis virus 1]|uniref:Uncharacterized protein n=1 Tax=Tetraselmis virus 1 TaxID=2060617 RepID=A0A2P0VN49_9VIRU|nr:hypothetical protein QJ968_gp232 [Tetraselmis virus 1]AUF82324.1 hypothetical protein TetV_232 [Tetraselmis virus 1]